MPKPMKRREVIRAMEAAGCAELRDTGRHTVYGCPCGQHIGPVPRHTEISAGVVGSLTKQLACLPEGWLQ